MQLELFCAEETVRQHEQRIASHVQREQMARHLASPRSQDWEHRRAPQRVPLAAYVEATRRTIHRFRCSVMLRRWSPCSALS